MDLSADSNLENSNKDSEALLINTRINNNEGMTSVVSEIRCGQSDEEN